MVARRVRALRLPQAPRRGPIGEAPPTVRSRARLLRPRLAIRGAVAADLPRRPRPLRRRGRHPTRAVVRMGATGPALRASGSCAARADERPAAHADRTAAQVGIDAVLSYCFSHDLELDVVDQVRASGVPWINFFCDSLPAFDTVEALARRTSLNWFVESEAATSYEPWGPPLCEPYAFDPSSLPDAHASSPERAVAFVGTAYASGSSRRRAPADGRRPPRTGKRLELAGVGQRDRWPSAASNRGPDRAGGSRRRGVGGRRLRRLPARHAGRAGLTEAPRGTPPISSCATSSSRAWVAPT